MKQNKQLTLGKPDASVKWAYFQYLFNSFWHRPVGYVIAIVYLVYLAVILVIVPKIMHNGPLFIWNLTSFNIPIFSLFFIGASCAALAVTIFRISQEDGTELSISAKPLTKGSMVGLKVLVYLIIMFVVMLLAIAITLAIKPIFGVYSSSNTTGITDTQYRGIVLSMLVGNLVSILLFSGISVLICMVGGQVITMITSIGIAFILVMLNFIYGKVVKTPADVISDTYQTSINAVHTFTRKQYDDANQNTQAQRFAAIQCYVNDDGEEIHHYDTYEYWLKAEAKAKTSAVAYLDFGNQLSSLYSGFGLEGSALSDVEKQPIGDNTAYKYTIDKDSHVSNQENIDAGNYPIGIFNWEESQGKYYPCITTIGPGLEGSLSDWYLYCLAYGLEFDAVSKISSQQYYYRYPGNNIVSALSNKTTLNINDLFLTDEQKTEADTIAENYWKGWNYHKDYFNNNLTTSTSGIWEGNYSDLSVADKFKVNSKLQFYIMIHGQDKQNELLKTSTGHSFPFSTKEVVAEFLKYGEFYRVTYQLTYVSWYGFSLGSVNGTEVYSQLNTYEIPYCESYCNMYTYKVTSLYSTTALTAIWGSIAVALFAVAIIVYKKKDFK